MASIFAAEKPFHRHICYTTQYDRLTKLSKEFEPYRNLWISVSDWVNWSDQWMNDPLSSVNAEDLEKNVSEAYKIMHKSVKYFGEVKGL